MLPIAYMCIAFSGTFLSYTILRFNRIFKFTRLILGQIFCILLILVLIRFSLVFFSTKWEYFILPVFYETLFILGSILLASISAHFLTVNQNERLLGIIISGKFVAEIISGILIKYYVTWIGVKNFFIIAAVFTFLYFIVVGIAFQTFKRPKDEAEFQQKEKREISLLSVLKNRYYRLIIFFSLFFIISFFFIENAFYGQVALNFIAQDEMAGFLGQFASVSSFITLLFLVFITGNVLNRFGLLTGLLIFPALLFVTIVLVEVSGRLPGLYSYIFWFTALTQLAKEVLNYSFNHPTRIILFRVIPISKRYSLQTISYGLVDPLFCAIAGIILFILMTVYGIGSVNLLLILIPVLILWMGLMILIYKEYKALSS
ncbi:MAG: hypothetical protein ABIA04_08005 [Pseudomonadota bacterium]